MTLEAVAYLATIIGTVCAVAMTGRMFDLW